MSKSKGRRGARAKLRDHFLANIGKVLNSDDLREVAGISEWARRIRELRNEEGYQILTHNDRSTLKPGEYLLENAKPQPAFERNISKELRSLVLDRNGFTCQMCGAVAENPTPTIPIAKPASTSATSSTNPKAVKTPPKTSELSVPSATKEPPTSP